VGFHLYPLVDKPIGRGKKDKLPKWLIEYRGLDALEKDQHIGKLYANKFAIFDAWRDTRVAVQKVEKGKPTNELAFTYFATLEQSENFAGVHLRDLHTLDKLFGIHTFVCSLAEDRKVELVHRPTDIMFYLNSRARKLSDSTCTMTSRRPLACQLLLLDRRTVSVLKKKHTAADRFTPPRHRTGI